MGVETLLFSKTKDVLKRFFFVLSLLTLLAVVSMEEVQAAKKSKKASVSKPKHMESTILSNVKDPSILGKQAVLSRISLNKKESGLYSVCTDYFFQKTAKEKHLNFSGMGNVCWEDAKVTADQEKDYLQCFQRLQLEFRKRVEINRSATVAFVQQSFKDIGKTYRNCSQKIDLTGPWPTPATYVLVHSDIPK